MELMLTWDVYKSNITSLAFYNSKMSSEYGFENLVTVCKIKKKNNPQCKGIRGKGNFHAQLCSTKCFCERNKTSMGFSCI